MLASYIIHILAKHMPIVKIHGCSMRDSSSHFNVREGGGDEVGGGCGQQHCLFNIDVNPNLDTSYDWS